MERYFEMAFGAVAHHLRQRQRFVFGPGDFVFARLKGLAEVADECVGCARVRIDWPAAEVEGGDVAREFCKIIPLQASPGVTRRSPNAVSSVSSKERKVIPDSSAILPQALAPSSKIASISPRCHRADAILAIGHARVVTHLAAPRNDVVERKSCGGEHMIDNQMERMVRLAAQGNFQGILAVANVGEGFQAG